MSIPARLVVSAPLSILTLEAMLVAYSSFFHGAMDSAMHSPEADAADCFILSRRSDGIEVYQDALPFPRPKPGGPCFLSATLDCEPSSCVSDESSFLPCPLQGFYRHEAHILQGIPDFYLLLAYFPIPIYDWQGFQYMAHFGFFGRQPFRFFFSISFSAAL